MRFDLCRRLLTVFGAAMTNPPTDMLTLAGTSLLALFVLIVVPPSPTGREDEAAFAALPCGAPRWSNGRCRPLDKD